MAKSNYGSATSPMFIKVGRIQKRVEEKMGVSLSNDIAIYLLEPMASSLAREYPTSYLSLIEQMAYTIKRPDCFSYSDKTGELIFLRLYPRCGELFLLKTIVAQTGKPLKWVVKGFNATKNLSEISSLGFSTFYRFEKEKEREEA